MRPLPLLGAAPQSVALAPESESEIGKRILEPSGIPQRDLRYGGHTSAFGDLGFH